MSDTIKERLKKILVDQLNYPINIEQIHENSSLYGKGLGFNSIDLVSLVVRLEEEFDIFFEAENLTSSMGNFGELLLVIQQKLLQNGATPQRKDDL